MPTANEGSGTPSWHEHVAIALCACAVLVYEIAITRVLSVVLWYHFAFLAISLAMLGLGAPGVWFATRKKPHPLALDVALLVSGLVAPLSIFVLLSIGQPVRAGQDLAASLTGDGGMLLVLACVLAPMLCLGSAVCLLLMRAEGRRIGPMYAADLLGATAGAACVVPLMHVVPTPLIAAATGLLPLAAALLLRRTAPAAVLAAGLAMTLVWGEPFRLKVTKSYVEPENLLLVEWTPTARIAIFPDIFYVKDPKAAFGWGMGSRYEPKPLDQLWIEQDGSAGTPITRVESTPAALDHLDYDVTSVGYQLRPPTRAVVIGAGGGRDVLTAVRNGAQHVDAVELNGSIVAALSGPFREFSGDVYHMPGVHPVVSEGRSFLTRSSGNYDIIQISLIDSWAATAAGAFSLSENYLYTVEAMRLYWQKISDHGVISISRWMAGDRELEGVRLTALITRALELEGVRNPSAHLAVTQAWSVGTFLISKTPLNEQDVARLAAICEERGFRQHWPRSERAPESSMVASMLAGEGTGSSRAQGLDLTPPTDDRPFFFQTVSLLANLDDQRLAELSNNEHSVALLRKLLIAMTAVTMALFLAPLALRRAVQRGPELMRGSAYFVCIGLGFMLVEVPWMQRFVLYLGHPSHATTVVLAVLLAGAGAGSMVAGRIGPARIARWGALLPVAVAIMELLLTPAMRASLGWAFAARVIASIVFLAPAGFAMGFAFPSGMAAFSERNKPWFWAMNGVSSVLATVVALAMSMLLGFSGAVWIGALCYGAAWLLLRGALAQEARALDMAPEAAE